MRDRPTVHLRGEGGSDGTHTAASRVREAGRGAPGSRAPGDAACRAARAARSCRLAPRVPEAGRRRRRGPRRRAGHPRRNREERHCAADRDRRRRHRRHERCVDARGQGPRLDGVRGLDPRRRADALGHVGLLRQRPGRGVLRRADRHRSHDDPPPRAALQPPDRRSARGGAERERGHVLVPRRLLPEGSGGQGLPADPQDAPGTGAGDELPDDVQDAHRRGDLLRPDDALRLDRAVRARRPQVAHGPASRRRLQHRIRRGDEGSGGAQPHLPARLPGEPGQLPHLREVGRAIPHRRRQRAAAERDRRLRRPAERQARLGDAVDPSERGRHASRCRSRRRAGRRP